MNYPKSKKEAIKRLIEKIEVGLKSRDTSDLLGWEVDCPFCQYITKQTGEEEDGIWRGSSLGDCTRCANTFGKMLGYEPLEDKGYPCLNLKVGRTAFHQFLRYKSEKSRKRFLKNLLELLNRCLAEIGGTR